MSGYAGQFDTRDARNLGHWESIVRQDPGLEDRYAQAMVDVAQLPIVISDEEQTVSTIESHCRRIARDSTPVLVVIDYLQQVRKDAGKAEREEQLYASMANRIRRLSNALECPILAASQVTVGENQREQAKGARALEESSDTTILVRRKRDAETEDPSEFPSLVCRKAKLGVPFGRFKCRVDMRTGRWYECADRDEDTQPKAEPKQRRDRRNE